MPRAQKLHCKWNGCPYGVWDVESLHFHESQKHVECACHRFFLETTIYRHHHRCSIYRAAQLEVEQVNRSECSGCTRTILEGQHYLLIPALIFQTRMPVDYVPVRRVPDTEITDIILCTPGCLAAFALRNELLEDVFGSWAEDLREYEMIVDGGHYWYSLNNAASAYISTWARVRFGDSVREPDGSLRPMTADDQHRISSKADNIRAGR